jgi:iron complex outermembrane receptor protein
VFWSNWDLGDVTKSLQVQRGLSASKIAVPSVGGTINVLTRGFDDKRSVLARVEGGSNNYQKYSLMLSSGALKNDWAFTFYGSRRTSDGWVDHAFDDAWTYFGNISKRVGKHRLSLTGLGSPQRHGTRQFQSLVGLYSTEKAAELGAKPVTNGDHGFQYNPYWGTLKRYTYNGQTRQKSNFQDEEVINERSNYYHKPQINLNDFWQVSDKLFISTVLYASFGNGGGVSSLTSGNSTTNTLLTADGQTDFQKIYDNNVRNFPTSRNPVTGRNDTLFSQGTSAAEMLINSVNSHRWYGFVTGADYMLNDKLTLSVGVDGRSYYGLHYREIRDLLGADYAAVINDKNTAPNTRLGVGDKISYNYDGKTRWLGGYTQLEYKTPLLSAVISATISQIGYKRIDYFLPKQLTVGDSTYNMGYGKTETINGQMYTAADAHNVETPWTRYTGYSFKAGANYNLTEHDNVFINVGYNNKVPLFNQVYTTQGLLYPNVKPEGITSLELGYGINYPSMKVMLNAYYTLWSNKSTNSYNSAEGVYSNVRNVDARHMGIELSVAQEISRRVQLNAAISLGDWRWVGQGVLNQTDEAGFPIPGSVQNQPVYLDGVHVGDAAQNQFQLGMRIEPFRGFYVRPSFLLFTKYYAAFNPDNIVNPETRTDSYRLPTSRNLDLHFGYDMRPMMKDHLKLGFKASVLNVLNEFYFTDVSNRSSSNIIDPNLIQAFFNRGRTFTLGVSATL